VCKDAVRERARARTCVRVWTRVGQDSEGVRKRQELEDKPPRGGEGSSDNQPRSGNRGGGGCQGNTVKVDREEWTLLPTPVTGGGGRGERH
jgi:hypothetical protein